MGIKIMDMKFLKRVDCYLVIKRIRIWFVISKVNNVLKIFLVSNEV